MRLSFGHLILLLLAIAGVFFYQYSQPWEITGNDFDRRVLQSRIPVLVYFDAAPGCEGAFPVYLKFRSKWKGKLDVLRINAQKNPQLARDYDVKTEVVNILFHHGSEVKRMGAEEWVRRVAARNDGYYSDDSALAELDSFVASVVQGSGRGTSEVKQGNNAIVPQKSGRGKETPLVVEGIFAEKDGFGALIGGKVSKKGDMVNGYKVTNIGENFVEFSDKDGNTQRKKIGQKE